MLVSLTWRQFKAVEHWATDRHRTYLDQRTLRGKMHDVAMPPAGWHSLSDLLEAEAFSNTGRGRPSKLRGDKSGTRSALHRITREFLRVSTHPALRSEGVAGCSSDFLAAWPIVGEFLRVSTHPAHYDWRVEPLTGVGMQILVPEFDDGRIASSGSATFQFAATFWVATEPGEVTVSVPGLFKEEEDHLGWFNPPEQ